MKYMQTCKALATAFLLLLMSLTLSAQKNYFQQEVHYNINVTLDDRSHTVSGNIRMEYVNHSPDALNEIWIHLWGNAFKNRRSAYNKQKLRTGSGEFYFAPDSSLGGYKNLDFMLDGQKIAWKIDPKNPDIAILTLSKPLDPSARAVITTPFILKIPASFSRLGHVGTSYQMTQWFPKPAVYDRKGWHAIPYLDMGEFYSEFGSFDVSITLPDNYVVGATGSLQTDSEKIFLAEKETYTRAEMEKNKRSKDKKKSEAPFPPSSAQLKTLRYTAENVHDFAWFADKRFFVLKDTARLASGRSVDCWAMFTAEDFDLWQKGAFYVRRAVEFYSARVGEYPWPQATAVHSALSAGGGMEYPMITVIGNASSGKSLDDVITHEVGHNWFYGILASNERDHTWMDEGMNSYYEERYMDTYYGGNEFNDMVPKKLYDVEKYGPVLETALQLLSHTGHDTPPDTPADDMDMAAYGLQTYMKTAYCMRWLEKSLGTERFDAIMQAYYQRWRFKHPYPEDFFQFLKEQGVRPEWFAQLMQTKRRADFALTKAKKTGGQYVLSVKNKGNLDAPYAVSAYKNGTLIQTEWYDQTGDIQFPVSDADAFFIDRDHYTLDYNRKNNWRRTKGATPGLEPFALKPFAIFKHPQKTTLGISPWLGWNNYDKTMLGLLLYNPPVPGNAFQYYLAPGYATASNALVGGADLRYRWYPEGLVRRITLGLNGRTFHDDLRGTDARYYTRFYRLTPWVRFDLRNAYTTHFRQSLQLRYNIVGREVAVFDDNQAFAGKTFRRSNIWEAQYRLQQRALPNPYALAIQLEGQQYDVGAGRTAQYLRAGLEWKQQIFYKEKKKIEWRFYSGFFLKNTERFRKTLGFGPDDLIRGSLSLAQNGYADYKYDHAFPARNGGGGILQRQVGLDEGGFKYAFGGPYAGSAGHSNDYILSLNLKADLPARLPLGIPLKPYFDLGYANMLHQPGGTERTLKSQVFWSGGFTLDFFKGNLNVWLPLVNSSNLRQLYCETSGGEGGNGIFCGGNYFKWISWSVKLDGLEPFDLADRLIR